jgi:hypothetical protein
MPCVKPKRAAEMKSCWPAKQKEGDSLLQGRIEETGFVDLLYFTWSQRTHSAG